MLVRIVREGGKADCFTNLISNTKKDKGSSFLYLPFDFLQRNLTMWLRLAWNSQSSYLSHINAVTAEVGSHMWLTSHSEAVWECLLNLYDVIFLILDISSHF